MEWVGGTMWAQCGYTLGTLRTQFGHTHFERQSVGATGGIISELTASTTQRGVSSKACLYDLPLLEVHGTSEA